MSLMEALLIQGEVPHGDGSGYGYGDGYGDGDMCAVVSAAFLVQFLAQQMKTTALRRRMQKQSVNNK